ncbi:MAG: prolyl oligopeptidase family serine peptidase [Verrucomicrobiae bacterium]|nr:prolyl oligopeptidase family serine peptidase [Verrucomicrobiae bacterium]
MSHHDPNLSPLTESVSPSRKRPFWRRFFRVLGILVLLVVAVLAWGTWYLHPPVKVTSDLVYGQRHGKNLTFRAIEPAKGANGKGVLFMVSGSWKSNPNAIEPWIVAPLLRRGYTVFAVCHISQPKATVMETADDIQRAVRYIRHHAVDWHIDPEHLGISGGSSGGHLSLMLATRGGPGDPNAADPVDRESSAVQAAAVFFPVTDLLNLGDSTENPGNGGPPIHFVKAFGPRADDLPTWRITGREVSPIFHVGPDLPPVFIIHGDADTLVPVDQSTRFVQTARESGATIDLVIRHGKGHGWITMVWDLRRFADWYDRYLFDE